MMYQNDVPKWCTKMMYQNDVPKNDLLNNNSSYDTWIHNINAHKNNGLMIGYII